MPLESRVAAMTDQTTKIECQNLSKIFKQRSGKVQIPVLESISLSVVENEFLVIVGPGQCGKTTLLRIIAGLETPTTGKVFLDGKEVTGPGPDRGMVFQKYTLFPWKTVMGNVEMGLKIGGMSKRQRREVASHYINLVGLQGFEKAYPHQLSGGMKQRVGIARAYANNPKVLLLDEPFGQLDAQTRYLMEQETARIWSVEKKTVIFVTNSIEEAVYLADRIVTLEGKLPGRLKSTYVVNLPRPREHIDKEFLEMRHTITKETELLL
ncbi:MAG: ABC transporter ATP-binding protein [Desulfobacterales bacterium]|nr:ABC transporter ATP-binding protein [Desulfobacterales bacterium]